MKWTHCLSQCDSVEIKRNYQQDGVLSYSTDRILITLCTERWLKVTVHKNNIVLTSRLANKVVVTLLWYKLCHQTMLCQSTSDVSGICNVKGHFWKHWCIMFPRTNTIHSILYVFHPIALQSFHLYKQPAGYFECTKMNHKLGELKGLRGFKQKKIFLKK